MKIFIITMDDPIQTNDFIKAIIDARGGDIVGLAVTKAGRLTISKGKSKIAYIFSLLLIMGFLNFLKNAFITLWHRLRCLLHKYKLSSDPSILSYARSRGIPVYLLNSLRNEFFLKELATIKPDIIINQSQNIIRKEILDIPTIGVINRHNALLPKNRGRLTPFWVLYKNEKETGVSIHFLNEKIDSGPIIVQEKFAIMPNDNFNSIVRKNYQIAPVAMLKALDLLEKGFKDFIENNDSLATYNSIPSLKEALNFRVARIVKFLRLTHYKA